MGIFKTVLNWYQSRIARGQTRERDEKRQRADSNIRRDSCLNKYSKYGLRYDDPMHSPADDKPKVSPADSVRLIFDVIFVVSIAYLIFDVFRYYLE